MDFETYQNKFLEILDSKVLAEPYDDAHYINYAKLNWSRQQRWLKTGVLNPELVKLIQNITQKQIWAIITEPWCGDAAHTLPFIHKIAACNQLIEVEYYLRDEGPPFLIDQYLTKGSRSIPKLIIKDSNGHDLAVWGPRPAGCQLLYDELLANKVEMDQKKIALQKWYNEDKGQSFQLELLDIISKLDVLFHNI